MRFLLVSADQPSIKKHIELPNRLVPMKNHTTKRPKKPKKMKRVAAKKPKKIERVDVEMGKVHTKRMGSIYKPNQSSKSIIQNGVHNSDQRKFPK